MDNTGEVIAVRRITRQRAIASWVTTRVTRCISAAGGGRVCLRRQIVNVAFAALQALTTVALTTLERSLKRFCRHRVENNACQAVVITDESKYSRILAPSLCSRLRRSTDFF